MIRPRSGSRGIRPAVVATAAAFAGAPLAAWLFFAGRNPYETTVFDPCPVLALTGLQCPGCGATRAAYSAVHGDWLASLAMNPIVLVGYVASAILAVGILMTGDRGARRARILTMTGLGMLVATLIWSGVGRNVVAYVGG